MSEETIAHAEKKNRTVICTVVFVDIVKFSEFSVGVQTRVKEHFNQVVGHAVENIPLPDRMMLDTGDGIALCLFGDPEQGMFLALALRDGFSESPPDNIPGYLVRIGLNLGPIKVVTDVNGQYNAIGDGINVAQRVMNFAEPGQVLCARSYFEIVSRLSDDFSKLFEYCGVRHDKHVREHDVYEVRTPGSTGSGGYDLPQIKVAQGCELEPQVFDRLVALLAKFEGPFARVIVKRACEAELDPEAVVQKVASGIQNPVESSEFVKRALAILGSSGPVSS